MEQIVIDFFSKASELILHNRLPNSQTWQGVVNKLINPNPTEFQLSFDQKYNFPSVIPIHWAAQANKLLVIEFFLHIKPNDTTKFLVEQWIFDINEVDDNKLKDTIDSTQILYKKLSVLLRTISLLTVTLPLYRHIIRAKEGNSSQAYIIEHSINFSRHTLSKWDPIVHEEMDLHDFKSLDFVLPGRIFGFKVNYCKSLKFLHMFHARSPSLEKQEALHNKLPSVLLTAEKAIQLKELNLIRRAHSDSHQDKEKSMLDYIDFNNSPLGVELCEYNEGYEKFYETGTKFVPPFPHINTQRQEREGLNSLASKREMTMFKPLGGLRMRTKTFGPDLAQNMGIFGFEQFNKRTSEFKGKENKLKNQFLNFSNVEEEGSNEYQTFRKISEEFEQNKRKLSSNTKGMETIIRKTEDDKIAELIHSIEELKSLSTSPNSYKNYKGNEKEEGNYSPLKAGTRDYGMGFRFELFSDHRRKRSEETSHPLHQLDELKGVYLKVKRSGSVD